MDQLTKAQIESRPIELADKVLAAAKLRHCDDGIKWQSEVNDAAALREIVGRFVAGMDHSYGPLDWIDNIISCQSIYEMPSQTELLLLRHEIDRMCDLLANAYDNLNDMPISGEWAADWCGRVKPHLRPNTQANRSREAASG